MSVHRFVLVAALAAPLSMPDTGQADPGAGGPRVDGLERAVVRLINEQRRTHGLERVRLHRGLNRAADAHSRDMVHRDYFAHDTLGGPSWHSRIRRHSGKKRTGEILAYTSASSGRRARRVLAQWMASPGHRAAILDGSFRRLGVGARTGRFAGQRSTVFTVDFSR